MTSMYDVLRASKGLPVDDIFAELWGRKLSGGYTIDVYTGTLPATLTGTKAGYLHGYKIYGNTEQTGTPTPDNPIVPSECGERTGNLFDENTITRNQSINYETGATFSSQSSYLSDYIDINDAVALSILISNTSGVIASQSNRGWCFFDAQQNFISGMSWVGRTTNSATFTVNSVPENAKYLRFSVDKNIDAITLIKGSTAPTSYIPYGYKLPLSSAGQSVDIYLGESQTTRRIKKLVFDGTENWELHSNKTQTFKLSISYAASINCISSHYTPIYSQSFDVKSGIYARSGTLCIICDMNCQNLTDFKAFLTQQYTNGTPVTVWYVLATEETGTRNEPLRKIGNYVDTIDSTQTTAQIPTSAGSTTISWAGEGLAPSQVEFEYERRR